jgi:hypothetical protein
MVDTDEASWEPNLISGSLPLAFSSAVMRGGVVNGDAGGVTADDDAAPDDDGATPDDDGDINDTFGGDPSPPCTTGTTGTPADTAVEGEGCGEPPPPDERGAAPTTGGAAAGATAPSGMAGGPISEGSDIKKRVKVGKSSDTRPVRSFLKGASSSSEDLHCVLLADVLTTT